MKQLWYWLRQRWAKLQDKVAMKGSHIQRLRWSKDAKSSHSWWAQLGNQVPVLYGKDILLSCIVCENGKVLLFCRELPAKLLFPEHVKHKRQASVRGLHPGHQLLRASLNHSATWDLYAWVWQMSARSHQLLLRLGVDVHHAQVAIGD